MISPRWRNRLWIAGLSLALVAAIYAFARFAPTLALAILALVVTWLFSVAVTAREEASAARMEADEARVRVREIQCGLAEEIRGIARCEVARSRRVPVRLNGDHT